MWKETTGPKTEAGKAIVARNPIQHGMRSAPMQEMLNASGRAVRTNRHLAAMLDEAESGS